MIDASIPILYFVSKKSPSLLFQSRLSSEHGEPECFQGAATVLPKFICKVWPWYTFSPDGGKLRVVQSNLYLQNSFPQTIQDPY